MQFNTDELCYQLSNIDNIKNVINSNIISIYIIRRILKQINITYTTDKYHNLSIQFTILSKIIEMYNNIMYRQKHIYAILTIKMNLRKYINNRLYRYPNGLRLQELKKNFERMAINTLF